MLIAHAKTLNLFRCGCSLSLLFLVSCTENPLHQSNPLVIQAKAPRAPVAFARRSEVDVDLMLRDAKLKPVAGALVVIRAAPRSIGHGRSRIAVLFQGVTQKDGHVRGKFAHRGGQNALDVLVHAPGYTGAYEDEHLRRQLGLYAPSAWVRMAAAEVSHRTLALRRL